jgi:hypothetical protein
LCGTDGCDCKGLPPQLNQDLACCEDECYDKNAMKCCDHWFCGDPTYWTCPDGAESCDRCPGVCWIDADWKDPDCCWPINQNGDGEMFDRETHTCCPSFDEFHCIPGFDIAVIVEGGNAHCCASARWTSGEIFCDPGEDGNGDRCCGCSCAGGSVGCCSSYDMAIGCRINNTCQDAAACAANPCREEQDNSVPPITYWTGCCFGSDGPWNCCGGSFADEEPIEEIARYMLPNGLCVEMDCYPNCEFPPC